MPKIDTIRNLLKVNITFNREIGLEKMNKLFVKINKCFCIVLFVVTFVIKKRLFIKSRLFTEY